MPEKLTKIAKNILLAFVLITIGFALGRETASPNEPESIRNTPSTDAGARVVVYYAHTTFRCSTCNTIEKLAFKTLQDRFATELADGTIEWKTVNFQHDEAFAEHYKIVSSCVVVAAFNGDRETDWKRLDGVWDKAGNPQDFEEYVGNAVAKMLKQTGSTAK